ncbi:MAG: TRAP transporter small permease subunit [Rhodovibrionaceae bacterium]
MQALISVAKAIDMLNEFIGKWVAWLALLMVLVQFIVVLMRYVFGMGSIAMQESIIYMHGILFMLGAGYTLLHDGHVRVDIFYREASPRHKAKVDIFGVLAFLLPVCLLIWIYSWPYVQSAWRVYEGSKETSGIQGVFLLKTIVLVFCVLVALQGIALLIRSLAVLLEKEPPPSAAERERL